MKQHYEITTDGRFSESLKYIHANLLHRFPNADARLAENSLVIAPRNTAHGPGVASILATLIAKTIVTHQKSHYISTHIKIHVPNELLRHAFVAALCTFDTESDFAIAHTLASPFFKVSNAKFNLDAFYDFRTFALWSRWDEICDLANSNAARLACPHTFCELVRYLISNIDTKTDSVTVTDRGISFAGKSCSLRGAELIEKIIDLSPRKIHLDPTCAPQIRKVVTRLWGEKLSLEK